MMKIIETKKYYKAYKKLSKKQKAQADLAIEIFKNNPFDTKLRNHALKGNILNMRAFSAANDLRIIYREQGEHVIVVMLDVGTHSQIY